MSPGSILSWQNCLKRVVQTHRETQRSGDTHIIAATTTATSTSRPTPPPTMGATMFTVQDERHQHYILASGKSNEVLLVLIHHAHVHLSLLSYYLLTRKQQQSKKQSKHSGSLHTKLRHSYMPLIKQTPNVFVISLEEKAFFSAGNKSFLSTFRNPTKQGRRRRRRSHFDIETGCYIVQI